jgi:hypothetical protein
MRYGARASRPHLFSVQTRRLRTLTDSPLAYWAAMQNKRPPFYATTLCFVILASCATTARAHFISADTYTRYELLAPETHQFKIYYEVTETRAGRYHFNQIRESSGVFG